MNITQARKRELINDCIYFEYKHNIKIIDKTRKQLLEEKGEEEYRTKFLKDKKMNHIHDKSTSSVFPSIQPQKRNSFTLSPALTHSASADHGYENRESSPRNQSLPFLEGSRYFDSSLFSLNIEPKVNKSYSGDFDNSVHSLDDIVDDNVDIILQQKKNRKFSVDETGLSRTPDRNGKIKVINRKVWLSAGARGGDRPSKILDIYVF